MMTPFMSAKWRPEFNCVRAFEVLIVGYLVLVPTIALSVCTMSRCLIEARAERCLVQMRSVAIGTGGCPLTPGDRDGPEVDQYAE